MAPNRVVLFAAFLLSLLTAAGGPVDPCRAISSGRNDVVYLAPATEPYEALPLGNGQLGVMLRNSPGMNYIFNHGSFFASAEQDNDLVSSGELSLDLPESWRRGFMDQRLVLREAMIVTRFQTGNDTHTIKSWLAEGLDLIIIQIESTAKLPELSVTLSIWKRDIGSEATASREDICLTTVGSGGHRATALAVRALGEETETSAKGLQASLRVYGRNATNLTLPVGSPVVIGQELGADQRTDSFGMLGIARDGQNLTRKKVQKALAEKARGKEKN